MNWRVKIRQAYKVVLTFPSTIKDKNQDEYDISCKTSSECTNMEKDEMYNIFLANMKDYYEKIGWNCSPEKKIAEIFHQTSKIVIARPSGNNQIVGFISFRYEADDEEEPDQPVVYLYEVQMVKEYQGKGIGRKLMELMFEVQNSTKLSKIMLTSFKMNENTMEFYRRMGFVIDETSPSKFGEEAAYEIMSR